MDFTQKPTTNCKHSGYSCPHAKALFDDSRGVFGMERRNEIIKEPEQLIMYESAVICFCYPLMNFVTMSTVAGHAPDDHRGGAATGFAA